MAAGTILGIEPTSRAARHLPGVYIEGPSVEQRGNR